MGYDVSLYKSIHRHLLRVHASDCHCRQMPINNKFGTDNINLVTTIGEKFCLTLECHLHLKLIDSCCLIVVNVYLNCQLTPPLLIQFGNLTLEFTHTVKP